MPELDDDKRDEAMDGLLRRTLGRPAPKLSPGFERELQKRVSPRPLSSGARRVLGAYSAGALVASVWALSDLPPLLITLVAIMTLAIPGVLFVVRRLQSS